MHQLIFIFLKKASSLKNNSALAKDSPSDLGSKKTVMVEIIFLLLMGVFCVAIIGSFKTALGYGAPQLLLSFGRMVFTGGVAIKFTILCSRLGHVWMTYNSHPLKNVYDIREYTHL